LDQELTSLIFSKKQLHTVHAQFAKAVKDEQTVYQQDAYARNSIQHILVS